MKIFKDKISLQKEILNKPISFIPTMGGLHKGHISLIKKSKKYKRKTLVSIFVNPRQFSKKSDYRNYPRNKFKDVSILRNLSVNYLYLPSIKDIYGFKPKNKIFLHKFSKKLCGKFRKGHFEGVINVMNRLIEIIKPKKIFMGKKDYHQLFLIKKFISRYKINSKIIECDTLRHSNGVAFSSRNSLLKSNDIKIASKIYHFINKIKKKFDVYDFNFLKKKIIELGANKVDYIENYNIKKNFVKSKKYNKNCKIFIAYYIKNVRLIDNI